MATWNMTTWNPRFGVRPIPFCWGDGETERWDDGEPGFYWLWSCHRGGKSQERGVYRTATCTLSDIST